MRERLVSRGLRVWARYRLRFLGLDWQCIALPLDAEPVRVIRADAVRWEKADLPPPFTETERRTGS